MTGIKRKERYLYGSQRLGILKHQIDLTTTPASTNLFERTVGRKNYKMSNHLGNVLEVVSDRKISQDDYTALMINAGTGELQSSGPPDGNTDYYISDVVSANDYGVWGDLLPQRNFSSEKYRFGFNGQEMDNEVNGITGGSYTAEFWEYDSRLGRRWNRDQITFPWESPYAAFHNNPIYFSDPLGLQGEGPDKEFTGFESCAGCGTEENPIVLNEVTISAGGDAPASPAAPDNTRVAINAPNINFQPDVSKQQFFKQGTFTPPNNNQPNPAKQFYNNNKTGINTSLYVGGLSAKAVQEILNNTDAVSALREGKMLAVYNGEVRVWSLNFHGNKSVPSSLVTAEKLAFLDKSKPLLRLSNAAKVGGAVFGIASIVLGAVEIYDQPSSGENWINLGIGVASLNATWGWTVFPTYMIMRGAIESPQSFYGGPSKSFSGADLPYTPSICFIAGTKILMADGSQKNIEDVKIGDVIKSYNFETKQIEDKPVLKTDAPLHRDLIDITFTDGVTNSNTFDHPYFVKGKGWCSYKPELTKQRYGLDAKVLQAGDICYIVEGGTIREIEILSIKENWGERKTYNLTDVAGNHNFFANGILVHNKHIIPAETEEGIISLEIENAIKVAKEKEKAEK